MIYIQNRSTLNDPVGDEADDALHDRVINEIAEADRDLNEERQARDLELKI